MSLFIKLFENYSQYETYTASTEFITPNVSLCANDNEVYYNPYVKPETRVVVKYNVTSTSSPTKIGYKQYISGFSEIEIDDVVQPSVVSAYTFDTLGEHTLKYTLTDPTSIGGSAFRNCSNITSISIPSSVTSIGYGAFDYCGLTSIDIPNSVTSIGEFVFEWCVNLTSIVIPNGVTSINGYTFQNCSAMTTCTIGSGVTSIGERAFNSCKGLTSIAIPSGVTSIGNYAFNSCEGLTSIDIPSGVTSIGESAFEGCESFTSIIVRATTPPTLNSYAFESTNNCPIYVPSANVETYKSTSGWSTYASRIQAIS